MIIIKRRKKEEEEENEILEMESRRERERELRTVAISQHISRYCTIAARTATRKSTSPHPVSMAVQRARAISCLRWTTAEAEEAREHNETAYNGSGQ